jgi:hypothetical protein
LSNDAAVGTARPPVPHDPPAGFHWEAAEDVTGSWRPADPGKPCRYRGSGDARACGSPAVVRKIRGIKRRIWWNYCADPEHAEGHWAEHGKVMHWQLAEDVAA